MTLETVQPLLAEARTVFAQIVEVETAIRRDYDRLLSAGWQLGRVLSAIKKQLGHSRWLIWLGANLPELAGQDGRKASDCMAFHRANAELSNPSNLTDFTIDSVRGYLHGYLPAKIRPRLEGDERLAPVATFDAGTNKFSAYFHRVKEGHVQPAPLDQVAPQVRLIVDGLREIYGRGPIDALLA